MRNRMLKVCTVCHHKVKVLPRVRVCHQWETNLMGRTGYRCPGKLVRVVKRRKALSPIETIEKKLKHVENKMDEHRRARARADKLAKKYAKKCQYYQKRLTEAHKDADKLAHEQELHRKGTFKQVIVP